MTTATVPTALVVYESMFGNTHEVAEAVADGLREQFDVTVNDVTEVSPDSVADYTLIVAGAPTHAFSLSRPATRADAITSGARHGSADLGLREWLSSLPNAHSGQRVATFDTRVDMVLGQVGAAARAAARLARGHGYPVIAHQRFRVVDKDGPLVDGELDRARRWGAALCATATPPEPRTGRERE